MTEIGSLAVTLSVLTLLAHVLGYVFERLRQPRLLGEILAGVLLGPFVLGHFAPAISTKLVNDLTDANQTSIGLNCFYWIGLILLMFLAGTETRGFMAKENRQPTVWFLGVGLTAPFLLVLALGWGSFVPLNAIMGGPGQELSTLLVLASAVTVTSIPVIARIFFDLGIVQTRFASLILGFAVLEDIVLWGVLAVATGIASSKNMAEGEQLLRMVGHSVVSLGYMGVGLILAPQLLRKLHEAKWNVLVRASPAGYVFGLLCSYVAVAALLDVNFVFAAFLAGFGLVGGLSGSERQRFSKPVDAISKMAKALFIPIYFAVVGYKLILGRGFSLPTLLLFLIGSSLVTLLSFGLAARLAGFRGLDLLNLSIAKNARGGPGIVLATVAFEAGIINSRFYTTLVLSAIVTSQTTGVWLRYVLSKGWPLLSTHPGETSREVGFVALRQSQPASSGR